MEFDIEITSDTLKLHQKFEGDVGCVVWDAAIVLAKYLEVLYKDRNCLKGSNVVEIGSEIGCVGITAACLGANAILTDLPDILPLLRQNIEVNKQLFVKNNGSATATALLWGETLSLTWAPHKIFVADCIYYKESIKPVISTLKQLARTDTEIIVSQELRDSDTQKFNWRYFLENLKETFDLTYVPLSEQNNKCSSPDIVLLKLRIKNL